MKNQQNVSGFNMFNHPNMYKNEKNHQSDLIGLFSKRHTPAETSVLFAHVVHPGASDDERASTAAQSTANATWAIDKRPGF